MTRRKPESREVWSQRVERWRVSGKSASEYAAEIGVHPQTLSNWRWKLSKPSLAGADLPKSPTREGTSVECGSTLQFVELVTPVKEIATEPFELVLADEIRIRVPAAFNPESLRRLMDAVGTR